MRVLSLILFLGLTLAHAGPTPLIRGRFDLIDARTGLHATQDSYAGKYRLVFFGFTHCRLTCPVGMQTLSQALAKLGKDADQVQALFITIDPRRDTAKVMASYLANFDKRIIGLLGGKKAVTKAMKDFRLEAERMGKGADYQLEHPAIIYLMGKNGNYIKTLPSSGDVDSIVKELRLALKAP